MADLPEVPWPEEKVLAAEIADQLNRLEGKAFEIAQGIVILRNKLIALDKARGKK